MRWRALFGQDIFANPDAAFDRATFALQKYQQEEPGDFAPYTSKYDALLAGTTRFYVRRDTNPEEFYPLDQGGQPLKFNELPPEYQGNVNTSEVPYNRHPGDIPALSDSDIEDVIAFLNTLSDGYQH